MPPHPFILTAALLACAAVPAQAQSTQAQPAPPVQAEARTHHVSVRGEGEARAAPDLASLSLTVLRSAETAGAAMEEANEAAGAVTQAMRDFGIEDRDLQTGRLSVTPQYRYENRADGTTVPPQILGYEVRNTLGVRVRDLDRLGEILDRAVELGVNEGGDIRFEIEDTAALEDEAREAAFESARASAETLARAAGRSLGEAIAISDEVDGFAFPPPMPMPMLATGRMAADGAASGVPVEIGENTVTARVRVVFELGDGAP